MTQIKKIYICVNPENPRHLRAKKTKTL